MATEKHSMNILTMAEVGTAIMTNNCLHWAARGPGVLPNISGHIKGYNPLPFLK